MILSYVKDSGTTNCCIESKRGGHGSEPGRDVTDGNCGRGGGRKYWALNGKGGQLFSWPRENVSTVF